MSKYLSQKRGNRQPGYTLVELLLYVALLVAMLGTVSLFMIQSLSARAKSETIAEVEQQGNAVMHQITQAIRNAEGITLPIVGASSGSLTLDVVSIPADPTVFDLASGAIRITEGASPAVALTGSTVTASGLVFSNVSLADTPGIVRIEFTLSRNATSSRNEFQYSKTFRGSASIRP